MKVILGAFAACLVFVLSAASAMAQTNNLLIQMQPGGGFRVWHGDGPSELSDDEVMLLDSLAEPQGSAPITTSLGAARARSTPQGVIIELVDATEDKSLLIDRDACGHLKTWHAEGRMQISEDQVTDLVLAAVPGGGPRLVLDGQRHAKSFLTSLGVMVAIWRPRNPVSRAPEAPPAISPPADRPVRQ